MKKCLFVSYGGGHVNTIIPVIKELYKSEDIEVVAIGINLAANTLRKNHIACKTLADYMTEEVLEIGAPLAKQYHNFNSTVSFADSIAYYGFSMRDLIEEKGIELANEIFQVYDRRLFLPIEAMKEIIKKENPDVVIATTMHRFEAASLIAANELGIPTLKIEDLLGNINKPFPDKIVVEDAEKKEELINQGIARDKIVLKSQIENEKMQQSVEKVYQIYSALIPTKFAVLCEYTRENIHKRTQAGENVVITGQPAFDQLIQVKGIDKVKICQTLGLNTNQPIITFMSQPIDTREKTLKALINAMKEHTDKQLIIKLHPNEDGKIQEIILKELGYSAVITKEFSAPIVSEISDVVITVSSTTGLEAVVMDKPVISINVSGEADFIPYQDMGIGLGVYKEEEVANAIETIFIDERVKNNLKIAREKFKTDGKAARRVANLIQELMGNNTLK